MFKQHLIKFKSFSHYQQYSIQPEHVSSLVYPVETKYSEINGFTIFNQSQLFDGDPDWMFQKYGKLWNYHLQYLEILLDESLPAEKRKQWLIDLSQKINLGTLPMEPYPVSLRIIYSLQFLAIHFAPEAPVEQALKIQIAFLEAHLEKHLSGNHLLENYLSLVYGHIALNAPAKLNLYLQLLKKELDAQILEDGAHYENCLSYHAGIFCRLTGIIQLLRKGELHPKEKAILENYANHMYSWMKEITLGFSVFPLINDSVAWPAENWKLVVRLAEKMALHSKNLQLSESGYRWLHSGSLHLLMRTGPFLVHHQPGHQHADYLSICLYWETEPILIDPGISTYEEGEVRLRQKGSSNHNLVVERLEENQSELWSSFRVGRRAKVTCIDDAPDKITAEVGWYQGHTHLRTIETYSDGLRITDAFQSAGAKNHMSIALFHFDWTVGEIKLSGNSILLVKNGITIHVEGLQSITKESYQQQIGFNDSRKAERILVYFCGQLQTTISRNS